MSWPTVTPDSYRPKVDHDVVNAKNFQIHIDGARRGDDLEPMTAFNDFAGCKLGMPEPPPTRAQLGGFSGESAEEQVLPRAA